MRINRTGGGFRLDPSATAQLNRRSFRSAVVIAVPARTRKKLPEQRAGTPFQPEVDVPKRKTATTKHYRDPFREAGLLPLSEAAKVYRSHHQTLKRAVAEGRLPATHHGRNRIYVAPAALDAYFSGRPAA